MVVTRPGAAGVCVASLVTEELRLAFAHAPIPRQHMEGMTAANWGKLLKQKDVTQTSARVSLEVSVCYIHCNTGGSYIAQNAIAFGDMYFQCQVFLAYTVTYKSPLSTSLVLIGVFACFCGRARQLGNASLHPGVLV